VKVRLQHLTGAVIRDVRGARVGRLVEVVARREGMQCVVFEYHAGPAAMLERLGIAVGRMIGVRSGGNPLRIPWQQLDISDGRAPRLRCTLEELKAMQ
jgi:hypothetical protein